jgi:hypothetical protein
MILSYSASHGLQHEVKLIMAISPFSWMVFL